MIIITFNYSKIKQKRIQFFKSKKDLEKLKKNQKFKNQSKIGNEINGIL